MNSPSLALSLLLLAAVRAPSPTADHDLYLATISAASSALRLNETSEARRWLDRAPAAQRNWEWHYLNGLSDQSTRRVQAHDGPVTSVQFSPDGATLATTSGDKTVRLVNTDDGKMERTYAGANDFMYSSGTSADGRLAVAGGQDSVLLV